MMTFYKYHGAGNDFLLYDAREDRMQFAPERVRALCDRHLGLGSDGLMTLSNAEGYAFRMAFFNPDASVSSAANYRGSVPAVSLAPKAKTSPCLRAGFFVSVMGISLTWT